MSEENVQVIPSGLPVEKSTIYRAMAIMGVTTVVLSAAVIAFINGLFSYDVWDSVFGKLEIMTVTIMPYMISAVIAAITSIAIVTMLPFFKVLGIMTSIHHRLHLLSDGDLCSKIPVGRGSHQEIALTLNDAVDKMASRVSQMKAINRKQWDLLEMIRMSAQKDDLSKVMTSIEEMEDNWVKVAKIEEQLIT
ncbi:MAG: hypothetical protein ACREBV_00095 [Candidatus Zixiibacteriota bacterium]